MLDPKIRRAVRRWARRGRHVAADSLVCTCLVALPPLAQPGPEAEAPPERSQVVATFGPARPGGDVVLQRRTSRGWRTVARARQDRLGSAVFDVRHGTYRARTPATRRRTARTSEPVRTRRWRVDFEEQFTGRRLDHDVWNDQVRDHDTEWAARACARADRRARSVGGGVLHLGVRRDPARRDQTCHYLRRSRPATHPYLLFSQVATELSHGFEHGVMAARMKVQKADGMHSAFWLLPVDQSFRAAQPSWGTEIDVVEFFGQRHGKGAIGSHVQYYDASWSVVKLGSMFPGMSRVLPRGQHWWEEFHVFSVEWTAQSYVFRVDGREYYRETRAISQTPQYLVLSMIPADYELHRLERSDLDDTAEVDWVRVYDASAATP